MSDEKSVEYIQNQDGVEGVMVDGDYVGTRDEYEQSLKQEDAPQPDGSGDGGEEEPVRLQTEEDAEPTPDGEDEKPKRPGQRERFEAHLQEVRDSHQAQLDSMRAALNEERQRRFLAEQEFKKGSQTQTNKYKEYYEQLYSQLKKGEQPTTPGGSPMTERDAGLVLADLKEKIGEMSAGEGVDDGYGYTDEERFYIGQMQSDLQHELIKIDADPAIAQNVPPPLLAPISALPEAADFVADLEWLANGGDAETPQERQQVADGIQRRIAALFLGPDGQELPPQIVQRNVMAMSQEFQNIYAMSVIQDRRDRLAAAGGQSQPRGADGRFVKAEPAGAPETGGRPSNSAAYTGDEKGENETWEEYNERQVIESAERTIQNSNKLYGSRKS